MGYIKEPEGVDFIIKGKPLTENEKRAISEFIKADKDRLSKQKIPKNKSKDRQHGIAKSITNELGRTH